ncbi:MAG: PEP-CTERM sorting domain-containing protein [Verrucomicrobiota bacterium]|jgi:hypothetical protein
MKLKILSAIAIMGLATCAFGQGLLLGNAGNTALVGGSSATSGGLLYNANGTTFNGNLYDVGVTVSYGAANSTAAGSLTAFNTYFPGSASNAGNNPYTGLGNGTFYVVGSSVTLPGATAGGSIWIELQMWDYNSPLAHGTFSTYAAAYGHSPTADVLFDQTGLANPTGSPPTNPAYLSAMPSIVLMVVPEPATFALVGLGVASLLAFRRRQ